MFEAWGRVLYRRRRLTLVVTLVLVAFAAVWGYGGVATVAVDMLAALTVLPALLALLGHRVNALRIRRSVRRPVTDIVTQIRGLAPPAGATVLVGGTTAGLVDELASLGSVLPWMALLVGV